MTCACWGLAIGFIGGIIARLQPRGLARTLFATALAPALVGAIALQLPNTASSAQIVILHGMFVALFAGAGVLFRHAARKGFPAEAGPRIDSVLSYARLCMRAA